MAKRTKDVSDMDLSELRAAIDRYDSIVRRLAYLTT